MIDGKETEYKTLGNVSHTVNNQAIIHKPEFIPPMRSKVYVKNHGKYAKIGEVDLPFGSVESPYLAVNFKKAIVGNLPIKVYVVPRPKKQRRDRRSMRSSFRPKGQRRKNR